MPPRRVSLQRSTPARSRYWPWPSDAFSLRVSRGSATAPAATAAVPKPIPMMCQVADRLPDDDPDRMSMRIEARSLLCASAFRVGRSSAETGFDELRELCTAAGDQRSLAIGMAGLVIAHNLNARNREASRLADELTQLLESIGDSTLTMAVAHLCDDRQTRDRRNGRNPSAGPASDRARPGRSHRRPV